MDNGGCLELRPGQVLCQTSQRCDGLELAGAYCLRSAHMTNAEAGWLFVAGVVLVWLAGRVVR